MKQVKITIVGTGYVGLVSGVCFAELGHHVTCIDTNEEKIAKLKQGIPPIYEEGLEELIAKNVAAKRLHFATDLRPSLREAEALFIAVGTPTAADGVSADLRFVHAVARDIAPHLDHPVVVVTKSTVPVLTNKGIEEIIHTTNPQAQFAIASNPEFLREGCAINDFLEPDRIVVGVRTTQARDVMARIYQPLTDKGAPLLWTTPESAEIIKYAANALLATKVAFINEVANLAEKTGGDIAAIANGVGLDSRIGPKFLQAGPGYGGSCFPKDTRAFAQMARQKNVPSAIIEAVITSNDARKKAMTERIVAALHGDVANKKIAVFGVTFKANTDDMRESVALDVVPALLALGAHVTAHDPAAIHQAHAMLPKDVQWHDTPLAAAQGADAVVVLTDWDVFKTLSLPALKTALRGNVLVDLRNIYHSDKAQEAGFIYHAIGQGK